MRLIWTVLSAAQIIAGAAADEPVPIIPEAELTIQVFPTGRYAEWPGLDGSEPIDMAVVDDRILLVWSGGVLNLDSRGRGDELTLITLFATVQGASDRRSWSPEGGVLCRDLVWRRPDSEAGILRGWNLRTGEVTEHRWNGPPPDALYAAPEGAILALTGDRAALIAPDGSTRDLASRLPPATLRAAAPGTPKVAWMEAMGGALHITDYLQGRDRVVVEMTDPAGRPWSLAWVGDRLVGAWSGRLRLLDAAHPREYRDERLPDRWYRLHGGNAALGILSPGSGAAALVSIAASATAEPRSEPDFAKLVERSALSAGQALEDREDPWLAEAYYGWILDSVRAFRSRQPLSETWPLLEEEVTRRRTRLRAGMN